MIEKENKLIPYFENDEGKIYNGDVLTILQNIPDESISMCVTSPPYWGLRDYKTKIQIWDNKKNCKHNWIESNFCSKCGAWKGNLGLEPTPELYIKHLVIIFKEIKRVLKKDGTLWLNLGDTYAIKNTPKNIKAKDLIGIPWTIAFTLRSEGWYLRQDIIWNKKNPMPQAVKDRCTTAHEYIFLLSKNNKYYYDYEAIQEEAAYDGRKDTLFKGSLKYKEDIIPGYSEHILATKSHQRWIWKDGKPVKNKRSVWTVSTKPFPAAHFATFPEKLITPCILSGCPHKGIVLDPFFGSGTTGIVAAKYNRKFIGIELNPEFCELAKKRIKGYNLDPEIKKKQKKYTKLF